MTSRIIAKLASLFELSDNPARIIPMEGIRGFAVLLVFSVHFVLLFSVYLDPESPVFAIARFAGSIVHSGVDLFFVLSGYLIYGNLLRRPAPIFRYLRRRAQRIYPAFLCVLAFYLVLHFTIMPSAKVPATPLAAGIYILENAALLPGIFRIEPLVSVAWSLSYEVFFDIAIPLIGVSGMRRWTASMRVCFFLAISALYTAAHLLYAGFGISEQLFPAAHPRMLMFVVGILVYEAHHSRVAARLRPGGETIAAFLFLASFVAYDRLVAVPWLVANLRTAICRVAVLSIGFSGVVLYSFAHPGFFHRVFSWTPLRWLGNMSYSYYLIHSVALLTLKEVAVRLLPGTRSTWLFAVLLLVGLLMTLAISSVLFAFVEKPLSLHRRRVSTQVEVGRW